MHLGAREDLELPDLRELGDDVLGHAVAEVLVVFGAAQVLEVEHGDRLLPPPVRPPRARIGRRGGLAGVEVPLEALQVGLQLGRALVAQLGVLLERLADDPLELRRHLRVDGGAAAASGSGWPANTTAEVLPVEAPRPVAIS